MATRQTKSSGSSGRSSASTARSTTASRSTPASSRSTPASKTSSTSSTSSRPTAAPKSSSTPSRSTAAPESSSTSSRLTAAPKSSSTSSRSTAVPKSSATTSRSTAAKSSPATSKSAADTKKVTTNSRSTASSNKLDSSPFHTDRFSNPVGLVNREVLESYANDFPNFQSSSSNKKTTALKTPRKSTTLPSTDTFDFGGLTSTGTVKKTQGTRSKNSETKVEPKLTTRPANRLTYYENPLDPLEQINQILNGSYDYEDIPNKSDAKPRRAGIKKSSNNSDFNGPRSIDTLVYNPNGPYLSDHLYELLHGPSLGSDAVESRGSDRKSPSNRTTKDKSTQESRTLRFDDYFSNNHNKLEEPKRTLRSSRKYKDATHDVKSVADFSIDEYIDTYKADGKYYQNKVDNILSDFEIPKENRREGNDKLYYNYILLDPRKCSNPKDMTWEQFLDATFYIGKGKGSRAFNHMKGKKKSEAKTNKKINTIKEIWNDNQPVKVFIVKKDIIGEEAYTREAAMIDAMGLPRLTNSIRGTYYGVAVTLLAKEKLEMGGTLLVEAWQKSEGAVDVYPQNRGFI